MEDPSAILNITDCAITAILLAGQSSENCSNGKDDNGNKLIDCADQECQFSTGPYGEQCEPEGEFINCNDGFDNDGDGNVDCDDSDCSGMCKESNCRDGLDNDNDGVIDCVDPDCLDQACTDSNGGEGTCNVGQCFNNEFLNCDDHLDNDNDDAIDCKDPDCNDQACTDNNGNEGTCNSGMCRSNFELFYGHNDNNLSGPQLTKDGCNYGTSVGEYHQFILEPPDSSGYLTINYSEYELIGQEDRDCSRGLALIGTFGNPLFFPLSVTEDNISFEVSTVMQEASLDGQLQNTNVTATASFNGIRQGDSITGSLNIYISGTGYFTTNITAVLCTTLDCF